MLLSKVPGYFKARRDALTRANPKAAFIFPAAPECLRNPDVHFPFRQESNFYYLTGFEEPEAFLVIAPAGSGGLKTVLFVRKRDAHMEMWEGARYGTEGALNVFGADEAYTNDQFDAKVVELLKNADEVYYRVGLDAEADRRVLGALEVLRRSQGRSGKSLAPIRDPNETVGEMRLFKSPEEAELMRKACQISGEAHKQVMKDVRPGMNEQDVDALLDYLFRKGGCRRYAYPGIVAGGKNATCLHYRFNNEPLRDGDLLLIDAGGEYEYYGADITRTFPVGRKFSKVQAQIYDLVLKSQLEGIAAAKPGATLPEIHRRCTDVLIDGMLSMGLLKGKPDEIFSSGQHKRFYPHNTSHWLGMDVHDTGLYMKNGQPRKLEPGMVLTIEPGFYVQPTDTDAPAEFRDIGIRIEDDVLITETGCEVLTRSAPKAREEIEALRSG